MARHLRLIWFMMRKPFHRPDSRKALPALPAVLAALSILTSSGALAQPLRLERIEISGRRHISLERISGSISLQPGDTITASILEENRLMILGSSSLIESVDLATRPGSSRGLVILEIEIEEKDRAAFETGYGYHDRYGWFVTLAGLRFEEPLGTRSQLRFGLKAGFHVTGLELEWKGHVPPGGGLTCGIRFHLYSQDHVFFGPQEEIAPPGSDINEPYSWDADEWRDFKQRIDRKGAEASLRYDRGDLHLSFGIRAESVEPDSSFTDVYRDSERSFRDFPEEMRDDIEKTAVTGLFLRAIRDTRNSFIYPMRGSYSFLWIHAANTILGGDRIFTRVRGDHVRYFDLGKDRVLAGRISSAVTSPGSPYYERFFIGGMYSIRGFRELSLSPTEGYDGYWSASAELRFPLLSSTDGPPRLSGLVFYDAGQGWRRGVPLEAGDIQSAAGYGMRLRLPWLGTLGIDAGIPFSEGRLSDNFYIHGALGFSF